MRVNLDLVRTLKKDIEDGIIQLRMNDIFKNQTTAFQVYKSANNYSGDHVLEIARLDTEQTYGSCNDICITSPDTAVFAFDSGALQATNLVTHEQ